MDLEQLLPWCLAWKAFRLDDARRRGGAAAVHPTEMIVKTDSEHSGFDVGKLLSPPPCLLAISTPVHTTIRLYG